jgi:pSer/pThr/pTyr-binding forkhead associated (FHA) protein
MNRSEALEFLGLKEPVNNDAILNKYRERYSYFQMLYSNAPNSVIKNIQRQNLDKLDRIKETILGNVSIPISTGENKIQSTPVTIPKEKNIMGWLIVHTENRKTENFNLFEGENCIGRKKTPDCVNSIVIESDPYISRAHAIIKCYPVPGSPEFELIDGLNKPSKNGIYLNGNARKIERRCFIRENDTIQIGTTKLMLKVNKQNTSVSREIEEVMKTEFVKTIVIDIMQ